MISRNSLVNIQVLEQNLTNKLTNNVEDVEFVNLLNNYSESLRLIDQDFAKSLEYCEIAKTISENLNHNQGLAESLLQIATCHVYMNDKVKPGNILKKSLAIFRKINDPRGEARALIMLGAAKLVTGDYSEAYDFVESGLNLSILTNYHKGQIIAYYKLAQINEKLKDFESTINFSKKALAISDEYDIKVRLHTLIGKALLLKNKVSDAKDFFNKALVNLKNYDDRLSIAQMHVELGKIALFEDDFDLANENFENGFCIFEEIGLLEHYAYSFIEISNAYIEKKDFDSALRVLKHFQNSTTTGDSCELSALVLMKMASIKINSNKSYEALNLINQAWEIVEESKNLKLQFQCQEVFSKAFELVEDHKAAFKHHKLFHEYKRKFDQQNADEEIEILTHRIKIKKQRALKQLATLKNIEIAQTIYEVHEKSNALEQAKHAISNLRSENELLHISNPGCIHCSVVH